MLPPNLFPNPLQRHLVAVIAVVEATLYPRNGRCACTCFCFNLVVRMSFAQHPRYFQPLRKRLHFVDRAEIIKKLIALLHRFQRQDRFEQLLNTLALQFLQLHNITPVA